MIRENQVEKMLDELEEEFAKANMPVNDKLTLFAKVSNIIYKYAEQEPCEDCISREDALQALCKAVHKNDDTIPCLNQRVSCLWDKTKVQDYAEEILKLPPVTPVEKQEPCTDTISRQAVLDLAKFDGRKNLGSIIHAFDVEQLPPVTPAEKVGRWIMHIDDLFPAESTMECNKCHEHQPITIDDNYCPNCGAKMQEVEE